MKKYYIKAQVDVYIYDSKEGEGEQVNYWEANSYIEAESPMEAAKTFFEKILYLSFEKENAHIEAELNGLNVLQYSNYLAEFAQGKHTVFVANSFVEIFELIPAILEY